MRSRERSFRLILPGAFAVVWLLGVYASGMVSNWLVQASLLVAMGLPRTFAIPMSPYGMSFRAIGAVIGVLLVLYAAGFWCDSIEHDRDPIDDAPPARSQARNFNQMDPMMGGMGVMGMHPGFSPPPDPMSPPPGRFG